MAMIDYVKGKLAEKSADAATVECCGIGYLLSIPISTYEKLPTVGNDVRLFAHHYVREDTERLFGFFSKTERDLFRQLIGINQIGPKVALAVLSGVSVDTLIQSVGRGDPTRLKGIPGVGPKTAQRLVMELKGKLGQLPEDEPIASTSGKASGGRAPVKREAFDAMMALGYNDKQVYVALQRVETVLDETAAIEEWIKKALQVI